MTTGRRRRSHHIGDLARSFDRRAHTPLVLVSDDEYEAGLARLHEAAATEAGPVVDTMDLLVLQAADR